MKRVLVLALVLPLVMSAVLQPATASAATGITTYIVPAITDAYVLPSTVIAAGYLGSSISMSACPGEYESASFVVRPNESIGALTVTASALTGPGTIDASCVDIRLVKVWWRAKGLRADRDWYRYDTSSRLLAPELLVKDADLVLRGDERGISDQNNYLKTTGGSYVKVDDIGSVSAIKDSTALTSVTIPAGTNQQFWVTVQVPASAAAGNYTGSISLGNLGSISVTLTVLPFSLQSPAIEQVMFVDGVPSLVDLQMMYDYGIDTIVINSAMSSLDSVMANMRSVGFTSTNFYFMGIYLWNGLQIMSYTDSDPARLAKLKEVAQQCVSIANSHGFTNLYLMGRDEASPSSRAGELDNYRTCHSAGAKVFACCDQTGTASYVQGLLDAEVWDYDPGSSGGQTEAEAQHNAGNRVLNYGNPQGGCELPETYRRNYGLYLWQVGYDGGMSAYWHWVASGSIWSDFGDSTYRNESMAFPTSNGNIPTIELAGIREAATDLRYLATLLKAIEEAKALGKDASQAESWLAGLKNSDLSVTDLVSVRAKMIGYILSFTTGSAPDTTAPVIASVAHTAITSPLATTTVTWTTDEPANSQVEYGKTTQLGLSTGIDSAMLRDHAVTLTSLDTNTTYYFRVKSSDAAGNTSVSTVSTLDTSSYASISFAAPTDSSGTVVARNWTQVDASVNSKYGPLSSFVDWNRSLVGYWDGNENSGSTLYDESTYGNNGTLRNGTQWTTGNFGSALKFDGVDDYAEIPNSTSLGTSQAITIEAWVKLAALPSTMSASYPGYFGKSGAFSFYWAKSNNQLKWQWYDSQGATHVLRSSTTFEPDKWYHLVYTFDGKRAMAYVDGALEAQETYTGTLASSTSTMTIGKADQTFNGIADEVRVWNRALSTEEIAASYDTHTGYLSITFSGLADGTTYQYYAYTTDAAGNSARTETRTLAVDTDSAQLAGDANGDGIVNAADITAVETMIVGSKAPNTSADANNDGKVNSADITKIERIIVGLS